MNELPVTLTILESEFVQEDHIRVRVLRSILFRVIANAIVRDGTGDPCTVSWQSVEFRRRDAIKYHPLVRLLGQPSTRSQEYTYTYKNRQLNE